MKIRDTNGVIHLLSGELSAGRVAHFEIRRGRRMAKANDVRKLLPHILLEMNDIYMTEAIYQTYLSRYESRISSCNEYAEILGVGYEIVRGCLEPEDRLLVLVDVDIYYHNLILKLKAY